FDCFPGHRAEHLDPRVLDYELRIADDHRVQRQKGQLSLFSATGLNGQSSVERNGLKTSLSAKWPIECPACGGTSPSVPEWEEKEALNEEKSVLGFYVSSHPLLRLKKLLGEHPSATTSNLQESAEGENVAVAGIIAELKRTTTRKGDPMAYLVIEDLEGQADALVFQKQLKKSEGILVKDEAVLVKGRVIMRGGRASLKVSSVTPLESATEDAQDKRNDKSTLTTERKKPAAQKVGAAVSLDYSSIDDSTLERLMQIFSIYHGSCPVILEVSGQKGDKTRIKVNQRFFVSPTEDFRLAMEDLLGPGHMRYVTRAPKDPQARNKAPV
ncbi:MAG: OB-fold nucleic acid binding domain-containing protein, partial [Candidatus Brocadiales bacterium]